jgi:hypothetical protein
MTRAGVRLSAASPGPNSWSPIPSKPMKPMKPTKPDDGLVFESFDLCLVSV